MSTTKKDHEPTDEPKKEKPKTALDKLRASGFGTKIGEWSNLKWQRPEPGTKFEVHGAQGVLVDDHDKPVVLDADEGNLFLREITNARPGDGVRLVPVS